MVGQMQTEIKPIAEGKSGHNCYQDNYKAEKIKW